MSRLPSRFSLVFLALGILHGCVQVADGQTDPPPLGNTTTIKSPATNDAASMAISPDGSQLAYVALHEGRNRLWVQDIESGDARVLPDSDESRWPFWSPDGEHLAYFSNDKVMRIEVATGESQVLVSANAAWAAGGTWGPDGTILYGRHGAMSIRSVSDDGSQQGSATNYPSGGHLGHFHPFFLPDGEHFLYYAEGAEDVRGIHIGKLGAPAAGGFQGIISIDLQDRDDISVVLQPSQQASPASRIVDAEANGVYAMGRLFFVQDGILFAQPFDTETLSLYGEPQLIADNISPGGRNGVALSASGDRVIYRTGSAGAMQQLTWFDRYGNELGTVGEPFLNGSGAMSISPDGSKVIVNRMVDQLGDIFSVNLATGEATQITDYPANNSYPIWSPDSQAAVFSSNRTVGYEAYQRAAFDTEASRIFPTPGWRHPMDYSSDGRYLVYRMNGPDLWVHNTQTQRETQLIATNRLRLHWPQISPDARWFAFQAVTESGPEEIFLFGPYAPTGSPFSLGELSQPLTEGGAGWVRWREDGRELYYVTPDGWLMAMLLNFDPDGSSFTALEPERLFQVPMALGPLNISIGQQYDVSDFGQRFLVLVAEPAESTVHVLGL